MFFGSVFTVYCLADASKFIANLDQLIETLCRDIVHINAKTSLLPSNVVIYPARALEERISMLLTASELAVVPDLACAFPFTGLSGPTEVARDPSTPKLVYNNYQQSS
jgi:hypothetical protein